MKLLAVFVCCLLPLPMTELAAAQGEAKCPAGYYRIGRGPDHTLCKPFGERLPVVSPSQFIPGYEAADLKRRIAALLTERQRYQDQLRKLERWSRFAEMNARDMVDIQREVFSNSALHALSIISASVSILAKKNTISPAAERQISDSLSAVTGLVHTELARQAEKGSTRQAEQGIEAAFAFKNLIKVSEKLMPAEEWQAFQNALSTLPKMLSISERYLRGEHQDVPVSTYLKHLDDVLAAGGELIPQLKALHSTAHIIDGEIALWLMRRDREAVEEAFIRNRSARQYYEKRLRESDELLKFYEERQARITVR